MNESVVEEIDIGWVLMWDGYNISEFHKKEFKMLEPVYSLSDMMMVTRYDMEWANDCGKSQCRFLARLYNSGSVSSKQLMHM